MDDFLVIGITTPSEYDNEAQKIEKLLESGVNFIHIRKPEWTKERTEQLILEINPLYYSSIKLHDHFDLVDKYGLGGVHLNARNPLPPQGTERFSRSCHTLEELNAGTPDNCTLDYQFLSPVFDSISKTGYTSRFKLNEIGEYIAGKQVVALGGITPARFVELKDAGFVGAAMIGSLW